MEPKQIWAPQAGGKQAPGAAKAVEATSEALKWLKVCYSMTTGMINVRFAKRS